jgi:heptosyltransferase-1
MLFSLFSKPFSFFGKNFLPPELADPRRILMTHFGNTAEIVRSIPILVALRTRFPYADIAWLIEENTAPLILDHWAVNRFIVVRSDWYKHFSEIRRVRHRLLSFAPQVAVDPQNSFGSSLATWLSGAKYRIGFGGKQCRLLHNVHVVSEETHRIERNQQLLQPLGIFGCDIGFDMPECEKDRIAARSILLVKGLQGNFAILNISVENTSARWREERYGALAKYLLEEWNLPSLIVWSGNDEESKRAEAVIHAADGAAHKAPWTNLVVRRSLSKFATIFVGFDTAELQIAAAVGTRCVGLFDSMLASENVPFGSNHRMVLAQSMNVNKKHSRGSSIEWLDTLPTELVCEKCDEVLAEILQPNIVPMQVSPRQKKVA